MRVLKIVVCIGVIVAVGFTLLALASPDNTPPEHYPVGIAQQDRSKYCGLAGWGYRVGVRDPESGIKEWEVRDEQNVKGCCYRYQNEDGTWSDWAYSCGEAWHGLSKYPKDVQITVFYDDTSKEMKFKVWAKNGDDLTKTSEEYTAPANPKTKAFPTLTEWGLIALGMLLAGSLAWMTHRRVIARPSGT
jgi:hypothetical protein